LTRPLALLCAGAWLGILVASWAVATTNFRMVDRVLGPSGRPELRERLHPLPADERRVAFRHLASELNRALFGAWGIAQLALAALALALTARTPGPARLLASVLLLIVIVQLALGSRIEHLGRGLDFVPRPLPPDLGRRFGVLHAAFVCLDLVKAALLAGLAFVLVRR
jgi:hypothetical protein